MSFGTGAGKGSLPRKVDAAKYGANYENIFGRKEPKKEIEISNPQKQEPHTARNKTPK